VTKCVCEFGTLREDNNIKQDLIAKQLNLTQSAYSRYETGDVDVPLDVLIKLAEYYNTSTDYLLGRTYIKSPYHMKTIIK